MTAFHLIAAEFLRHERRAAFKNNEIASHDRDWALFRRAIQLGANGGSRSEFIQGTLLRVACNLPSLGPVGDLMVERRWLTHGRWLWAAWRTGCENC